MSVVERDPMMKVNVRNAIFALLYVPAENLMYERIKDIIAKNTLKIGASHQSFMYKAENYTVDSNRVLPRPRNQLHPSLEESMQKYLVEAKELAEEKPAVLQFITRVLNTSDHPEDWRKLLIEALHQPVNQLLSSQSFKGEKRLTDEQVADFIDRNKEYTSMCKRRLVLNLITT
jgi:hypothetical protein